MDFQKAFDSVSHHLLWKKLKSLGLNCQILKLLVNMYKKAKAVLRINGILSNTINCNKGVRQGCPLSPILFCLYVSDLVPSIGAVVGGVRLFDETINGLLYADDVVLLANSEESMRKSLLELEQFTYKWKLVVNIKKTKMMRSRATMKGPFMIYGTQIEDVKRFKYLGYIVTHTGSLLAGVEDLAVSARKAYYALLQKARKLGGLPVNIMCNLFSVLIEPIMLYASEIWGVKRFEVMERVLLTFCKYVLQVPSNCSTVGVLGELGRFPFHLITQTRAVNYFSRISKPEITPVLTSDALNLSKSLSKSWYKSVVENVEMSGCGQMIERLDWFDLKVYEERLEDIFLQSWTFDKAQGAKLKFYDVVKESFGFEVYLSILTRQERAVLTRFRLSCHTLEIEMGRHHRPPIPAEERLCDTCEVLEDEFHFLFHCQKYIKERQELLKTLVHTPIYK